MARLRNVMAVAVAMVLAPLAMSPNASAVAFHSTAESIVVNVLPDGSGKTAHQVFDIANWPITCGGMEGKGNVSNGTTFTEWKTETVFYLPVENELCSVGGSAIISRPFMEGCNYLLRASGKIVIECPPGKSILYFYSPPLNCQLTIPPQTRSKVSYHNIEVSGVKAITMEISVSNLLYLATGTGCGVAAGFHEDGNYTTGNVILSAVRQITGEPVPLWIE